MDDASHESSELRTNVEPNLSSTEIVQLTYCLFDLMLDQKFSEYKCGFDEEITTTFQFKELKSKTKVANSFQLKGNKVQFEFNSGLLQLVNMACSVLLEGNLVAVINKQLEKPKGAVEQTKQGHLFGDKNPAGWIAVEEYDSEKLADDSEDEKKLRSTEWRALSKLCG